MVDWRSNDRRKPGECEAEQEDRNEWRMRDCTVKEWMEDVGL